MEFYNHKAQNRRSQLYRLCLFASAALLGMHGYYPSQWQCDRILNIVTSHFYANHGLERAQKNVPIPSIGHRTLSFSL
jgi:hypothetical protein